jgi:hypothetical protein
MNNFPYSILDSSELYASATRIYPILNAGLTTDKYITNSLPFLQSGLTDMEKALGKNLKSSFTSVLLEKNKARNEAFLGFRDFVSAYTHSSNATKKLAAINLQTIVHTTGNTIYKLGKADETTQMNALITALKVTEPAQWIQTIGAADWFTEVQTSELAFETENTAKANTESTINYPLLNNSKAQVVTWLTSILSYVDSNTTHDSKTFTPVVKAIDEVITDIVTIARARITREENEKKKKKEEEKK